MMWPPLQSVAQVAIGRTLNSLPEGLLIVLFAGGMLRLLPRQNSGTRFAVWFVALLAVAGLPLIGGISAGHSSAPALLAGGMLRLLPRQNSGTRFAVWFVALLAVAGLPLIGGISAGHSSAPALL